MKVAYLTNQYPKVSHSFIRREILALEELGHEIFRFSLRPTGANDVVDPEDIAEREKTRAILSVGFLGLFSAFIQTFLSIPFCFMRAFALSIRLGRMNRRGVLIHWIYLAEACVLKKWLTRIGVSHVHAHFGTNSTTVVLLCKFLGGPPFSFTVHGPDEFDDPAGLALGEKIMHAKFVVAISNFGCSQLMRQCEYYQWKKIKKVHCVVNNSFFKGTLTAIPKNNRFVCVGRLCEQKGQLLLLDAISILAKAKIDFKLIFAGDGEMRAVIEQRIKELGLEKQVTITGWIDSMEVRKEITKSRAMVLPSFAEGLPVVIMEALALGRPVVSTYVAGIPELVKDGINGFLVPAGSVVPIANALKKIVSADPEELQIMGEDGMNRVKKNHSAISEAKKLASFFAGTIS